MKRRTSSPLVGPRRRPLSRRARDFVHYRVRAVREAIQNRGKGWLKHRIWRRVVPFRPAAGRLRLHVGSGTERLEGWVNIDLQPLTEVDVCADITKAFPYRQVHRIFAEHFLEHLAIGDAMEFLVRCHDSLAPDGRLRLSTPNLDWVWATQYDLGTAESTSEGRQTQALALNRGFHAWGHRFLWNREILAAALTAAGFVGLRWCDFGISDDPEFRGLERHDIWPDTEELPHVLIVEADRGEAQPAELAEFLARVEQELGRMMSPTHR